MKILFTIKMNFFRASPPIPQNAGWIVLTKCRVVFCCSRIFLTEGQKKANAKRIKGEFHVGHLSTRF
jgi:hypothetical protein